MLLNWGIPRSVSGFAKTPLGLDWKGGNPLAPVAQSHSWGGELPTNSSETEDLLPARVTILWRLPSSQWQVVPTVQIRALSFREGKLSQVTKEWQNKRSECWTHKPLHFSKSQWRNESAKGCLNSLSGHTILEFCDCPVSQDSLAGLGKLWLHPGP